MIVDCFPFFNELDVLEIRLNTLAPYVDRFVISESPYTHQGKPKSLFFQENKERFKQFNITHLISDGYEKYTLPIGRYNGDVWRLEHADRENLMKGIKDCDFEDIILLSDADEIPDLSKYKIGTEGAFKQKLYYYYLNCYTKQDNWKGTVAIKKKNIKTLNYVRNHRNQYPTIVRGGWHFSTMGTPEQVKYKMESFAHIELNTDNFKDGIEENRQLLRDPYGGWRPGHPANWQGRNVKLTIEEISGPPYLLANKERYKHLIYAV